MSVCFFLPVEQSGASTSADENIETETVITDLGMTDPLSSTIDNFWIKAVEDVKKTGVEDFKTQVLPLARIKKIMKLDDEVKMISAEAPVLFAKAAELFIHELTLRAWAHTEDNKRRTLQRNDIAMAITKSDQFDFLIDIVPRHDVKVTKPKEEPTTINAPPTDQYYLQLAQQHQAALQTPQQQQQIVLQPCTQVVQTQGASGAGTVNAGAVNAAQAPVTLVQTGDSNSHIQLTQAQLNMIRLQLQNNPNQPILIQAPQAQSMPQIIQVSSQGVPVTAPQQVMLAQVAASQDDSA